MKPELEALMKEAQDAIAQITCDLGQVTWLLKKIQLAMNAETPPKSTPVVKEDELRKVGDLDAGNELAGEALQDAQRGMEAEVTLRNGLPREEALGLLAGVAQKLDERNAIDI